MQHRSHSNPPAAAWRRPRAAIAPLIALVFLGLAGCTSLMTQSKVSGVTETVFDDRLPAGIADYWNACMHKTLIWPKATQLDLRGGCPAAQTVPSLTGQMVYAAAVQKSPFPLKIPVMLKDIRT